MAWFLSRAGPVNGFTNHSWNGITTLEWAKVATEIMTGQIRPPSPILQVGASDRVTKYELLKRIAEIWPHQIEICPTEAKDRIDRTLVPDLVRTDLKTQLRDLRGWTASQE
jgi:dTDP-4-dehydrorhamnose reductase